MVCAKMMPFARELSGHKNKCKLKSVTKANKHSFHGKTFRCTAVRSPFCAFVISSSSNSSFDSASPFPQSTQFPTTFSKKRGLFTILCLVCLLQFPFPRKRRGKGGPRGEKGNLRGLSKLFLLLLLFFRSAFGDGGEGEMVTTHCYHRTTLVRVLPSFLFDIFL